MPSQLYKNEAVDFICGRNFKYDDAEYTVGEQFDQELAVGRLELLVRNRFLIPVVDHIDDKPRHWHREIRLREHVLNKLGVDTEFDPKDHKVAEVLEYAEEHPEVAEDLLEQEAEGKDRITLEKGLQEIVDTFNPEEHTVVEVLEYLTGDISEEESDRVIKLEREGKARKGILEDL